MSTEVYYGQWRHHYNITPSLSKHTHLFDKWTWSWGQVQFKQEKNKLRDEWIHVWTSFTVDHSADPSCGSLQSPDGFWGIKAKYGGETPIIVAVLLQHHYLHIQSSSGQKGIHPRTVPDSLFSDQAFLNHSSTVFGVTLARKMYVVWKLLQCTLMQLYLLCFITFYFQFGIYKWIQTPHDVDEKEKPQRPVQISVG